MVMIVRSMVFLAALLFSKWAFAGSAGLQLVSKVPVRANVEITQNPVTKEFSVVNRGSAAVKVQTLKREPASLVTVVAP